MKEENLKDGDSSLLESGYLEPAINPQYSSYYKILKSDRKDGEAFSVTFNQFKGIRKFFVLQENNYHFFLQIFIGEVIDVIFNE